MRRPRVVLTTVTSVFLGCAALGLARENEGCATSIGISGDDYHLSVRVPEGWVHDHEADRDQESHGLVYPAGTSRVDAATVMYLKTASKKDHPVLQDLISGDVERRKAASPGLRVEVGEPLVTESGAKAVVDRFSAGKGGSFESVAYVEGPAVYLLIVLSSKSEAAYRKARAAFADMVRSCRFPDAVSGIVK